VSFDFIKSKLGEQKRLSRFRHRVEIEAQDGNHIVVDGKPYINFSSNDYLGLAQHAEIKSKFIEGVEKFGNSASSSSLVTGTHYAHRALEDKICDWLNKEHCLLFSSGFAANTGFLNAFGKENTHFILDKLSHASIIDGAYLSDAKVKRFPHNNMEKAQALIDGSPDLDKILISEGIFSMDGDSANIEALSAISKTSDSLFYCDDAHAIGILGKSGEGSISKSSIDVVMATFGKALAGSGAFIASNNEIGQYLENFCRHYIYSTAITPANAWASIKAIEITQAENWRREKINALTQELSSTLDPSIKTIKSESSIQAIVIGDEQQTINISEKLKQNGFWVTAIRPPTVPNNSSRLRVTINSLHKESEIKRLAECINSAINEVL